MVRLSRSDLFVRCGAATLTVVVAAALALALRSAIEPTPFLFFYVAIAISGWSGGLAAGLCATILSSLLCEFVVLGAYGASERPGDVYIRWGGFLLAGGFATALSWTRKLALDAECQQRLWLERTLASIGDAVITTDRAGLVASQNSVAEGLTGWLWSDARGLPLTRIFRLVDDPDLGPKECPVGAMLSQETATGVFSYASMLTKSGRHIPIEYKITPIFEEAGRVIGAVLVFRDITERRLAEAAMSRLAMIVDASEDSIVTRDPEGRIATWNPGATRLYGYSAEEALGQPFACLIPEELADEFAGVLARIEQGERIAALETMRLRKGGVRVAVSVSMSPLRAPDGSYLGISSIARDITERKEAETQLRLAHDELEQRVRRRTAELSSLNLALEVEMGQRKRAEAARTELWRQIVGAQEAERSRLARELHDQLGQHLTALMLGLKAVEREIGAPEAALERLHQLHDVTGQIGQEVHRIAWELRPTALDDLGLATAITHYVDEWTKHTGIVVDLQISGLTTERFPAPVETTIYRIVQESLTNVGKHARAESVRIALGYREHRVFVVVEDDGRGFETNAKGNPLDGRPRLGVLGMKERLSLVGGSLEIESAPGEGTVVLATIPIALDDEELHHGKNACVSR